MQAHTVQTKVFRVEEFRNPTLPEERRQALEAAESQPLDMTVTGVLQAAQARAGLENFGPLDFKDRLARLLGEVEADANVWKTSKVSFVEACISAAANRLRNHDFLKRHPQIY